MGHDEEGPAAAPIDLHGNRRSFALAQLNVLVALQKCRVIFRQFQRDHDIATFVRSGVDFDRAKRWRGPSVSNLLLRRSLCGQGRAQHHNSGKNRSGHSLPIPVKYGRLFRKNITAPAFDFCLGEGPLS